MQLSMEKPEALSAPLRVDFDASSLEDQAVYLHFMTTGVWLKRFNVEWPSVTVPNTCERKLLEHFLQVPEVMSRVDTLKLLKPQATLVVLTKTKSPDAPQA